MTNRSKGIIFMVLAAFFFAIMAAAVKWTDDIPIAEKVFFRNLVGVFASSFIIYRQGASFKGNNIKMLLLRSILGIMGVGGYFYSISKLMYADAVILNKLSPFFALVFAGFFMKERLTRIQTAAIILAVMGAGLVIRPQFNTFMLPSIIAVVGAVCGGGAYTVVSHLRHSDSPQTIVFYFTVVSSIIVFPFMLAGQFVIPNVQQMAGLISIGVFATTAQMLMTYAYHYARAGEVSVYLYMDVIFSLIIGGVLFGNLPDFYTLSGAILVLSAGVMNYLELRRRRT